MEVSPIQSQSDILIKSHFNDYQVSFIEDSPSVLEKIIRDGDVIIMDSVIRKLHPEVFQAIPLSNSMIDITAHENQKSYQGLVPVIEKLVKSEFRKNHRLIAVGGGIVQDITSFIASILYRGVNWIFFPTTLLAQGDSCIGSKTSINFGEYKNQIGGFYPPAKVYIDLGFLDTLSVADMQSGLGEMSHYFVVSGEKDFKRFKKDYYYALKERGVLYKMISKSLAIKKRYIEIDEFDQNERQVFNYGHSFGHAIESLTNYSVPHGIAVSFGMDMANYVSIRMNLLEPLVRQEISELLQEIWQGYDIKNLDVEDFLDALTKDKKNVGGELYLILCKGYGKIIKTAVNNKESLKNWMMDYFENELA